MGAAVLVFLPIFLLALAGYLYARRWAVCTDDMNAVNMRVFLPLLVFDALVGAPADWAELVWVGVYGAAIVLGSGLLTLPLCAVLGWRPREMVPPMMFSNYGNMGLPLLPLAFGEEALPAAVMLFVVGNCLHLTVGFKIYNNRLGWREVAASPMLVAAALGVVANVADARPAGVAAVTLELAAGVAIPLMLFALGARLREVTWREARGALLPALWCPASGLICCALLWFVIPLPVADKAMVVVFAALPPALLNYLFAERFGICPARVAAVVMTGNLLSALVIPLVLVAVFAFLPVA